jgi:hypothetical protein
MPTPPSPLAYLLETVREVRSALGEVPHMTTSARYAEAADVVEDCMVQLAELRETWASLTSKGQLALHQAENDLEAVAGVLTDARAAEPVAADPAALDARLRSPGPTPDTGFADQPLW